MPLTHASPPSQAAAGEAAGTRGAAAAARSTAAALHAQLQQQQGELQKIRAAEQEQQGLVDKYSGGELLRSDLHTSHTAEAGTQAPPPPNPCPESPRLVPGQGV